VLLTFANWMHGTPLGWAFGGGVPWLWPVSEILHFIGLALLLGCIGFFDLRMLGMAKALDLAALQHLMPWGMAGFVINLVTGVAFFAGDPYQYIDNHIFWIKMAFVAAAGLNVAVFYAAGLNRQMASVGPGEDAPPLAKVVAAVSLVTWIGVVFWGRVMPFLGESF
jgi:hypothetical protein